MRQKQRQPHELLTSIWQHCMNEYNTPGLNDWHWAALEACKHIDLTVLATLPPKPAKRAYYGSKGSLTTPFR